MRGDEQRVVDVFAAWLEQDGWVVQREVEFVDLYAERGDERLYVEAKGRTTSPGLDVDTHLASLPVPPADRNALWRRDTQMRTR